MYIVIVF